MPVIFLALALILDAFDDLRFASLHISFGHLILTVFMAWLFIDILRQKKMKKMQRISRNQLALFWGIFWVLYVLGFLRSVAMGIEIPKIAAYDFKSYIFN